MPYDQNRVHVNVSSWILLIILSRHIEEVGVILVGLLIVNMALKPWIIDTTFSTTLDFDGISDIPWYYIFTTCLCECSQKIIDFFKENFNACSDIRLST